MQLKQLLEIFPAVSALGSTKLSAKPGYRVAKIINLIKPDMVAYDEQRNKLLQELGTPVEGEPGRFSILGDNLKSFADQEKALLEEEVSIDLPKIKIDDLVTNDGKQIEIEPMYLAALDGIILTD